MGREKKESKKDIFIVVKYVIICLLCASRMNFESYFLSAIDAMMYVNGNRTKQRRANSYPVISDVKIYAKRINTV